MKVGDILINVDKQDIQGYDAEEVMQIPDGGGTLLLSCESLRLGTKVQKLLEVIDEVRAEREDGHPFDVRSLTSLTVHMADALWLPIDLLCRSCWNGKCLSPTSPILTLTMSQASRLSSHQRCEAAPHSW